MLQGHCIGSRVHIVKSAGIGKAFIAPAFRIEACIYRAAGGDLNVLIAVCDLFDLNLHKIRKTGGCVFPVVRTQIRNIDRDRA